MASLVQFGGSCGDGVASSPQPSHNTPKFEEFYARELQSATRFAHSKMSSYEAAEDLTAEAFAITFSKWEQLKQFSGTRVKKYLIGVVRNLLCDFYRSPRRNFREVIVDRDTLENISDNMQDCHAEYSYIDSVDVVERAIKRLPRKQSEVLLMCIEGLTVAEIAHILGITKSTARSHIALARKFLRDTLWTHSRRCP
jgi:RNA polymerase sigma factor (sigma-70 family)